MTVSTLAPYRYSYTIGTLTITGRGFSNPVDMAITAGGIMYTVSRTNSWQAPMNAVRVTVCRADDEEYLGEFSGYGTDDGLLTWPTSIAVDSKDRVYVADEHRNDIQIFDSAGNFLCKWGTLGDGLGEINRPSGITIDSEDNLIVVDHLNDRIQKVSPDGKVLLAFGEAGDGPGQLNLPWGVAVDGEDQIWVADWRNDRVQKFSADGRWLATFGESGDGPGQLNRPAAVAVDSAGQICVADWGNERVQILSPDGEHLSTLTGDATLSKWGWEYIMDMKDVLDARAVAVDKDQERLFWGPTGVEVDATGRLYVADSCRHRVQVYQRT